MKAKKRNMADSTLRLHRANGRRIKQLERELKQTKAVIGTMAAWIAQTAGGCLSPENAAQLIEKLK